MKHSLIGRIVKGRRKGLRLVAPAEGYNQWSATYDTQPDNAVLALESRLFSELLGGVAIDGKVVADVGCGTGRHWAEILARRPVSLFGIDPSAGMLEHLKLRYPTAEVICSEGDSLSAVPGESCDIVTSTLALAHMPDPVRALREWCRVLRHGGAVLVTDFHADAFRAGLKRTFSGPTETIEIAHYATNLDRLLAIAVECGFQVVSSSENKIDESVRPLFERDRALKQFEEYKGLRLVFGIHLIKR